MFPMNLLPLLEDSVSSAEASSASETVSSFVPPIARTGNSFADWFVDLLNSFCELVLTGKISDTNTNATALLGRIVIALAVFIILYYFNRLVIWILKKSAKSKKSDARVMTRKTFSISLIKALLWVVLIVIVLGILGFDLSGLSTIISSGVVAIGLSLQDIIGNFASGVILLTNQTIVVGDYISVAGVADGTVKAIGILNTELVTPDNVAIFVANSKITSSAVSNYNVMKVRRINLTVGVSYNSDVDEVRKIIRYCIDQNKDVIPTMAKTVAITNFADSEIDFCARCYVPGSLYWDVYFALSEAIYKELCKRNISIPYPQMDIHMDTVKYTADSFKSDMTGLKNYPVAPVPNPESTMVDRDDEQADATEKTLDKLYNKTKTASEENKKKRSKKKAEKASGEKK